MNHPYLLFGGAFYYPLGGFDDYLGRFETIEASKAYAESNPSEWNWAHIVELRNFEYKKIIEGKCEFNLSGEPRIWEWEHCE